ncbi:Gfo/Idh/MocA family protein [Citrobacter rodentium]|uniref:Oxidoreductase n=2 Tax=Citrobacter rodentium TaxID=67825 RepID=D2TN51_CITRI|nr:Gfo/Idh/MocA family oxidoreductase [Citrobacter rodentium]KIQ49768.1 oxidoreductase [Citrobacter rodentium]QBY29678.1 Gfo/Idh/MocA family oxidoreductase [Citrobacter rodentium]UHO32928.1 Gfo/Idh/MocA family oxidoreductase [Citrobacter rodentium NBRC 105723 = DSM 16636]CBG89994.1 putative oxidoreductase [Citrobacter rodentium ICC168]HAT8013182.1 gfo/Idh/MocA family oxidoreductase [Citrobacter rodentium NBRC 105723 = DSM 16636]
MKTLNAAIIGCGAIHTTHVAALRQLPGVTLRAIAESDINKGQQIAAEYGCHFYHDYREMLRDEAIDVVHICTPHYLHKPMILAALAAGKEVFCEKPAVMRAPEVAEIATALLQAKGTLGICYQNRLNPTSLAIKQQLQEGTIGKMRAMKAVLTWSRGGSYYRDSPWRGKYATEGGCLLINQAIHTLDLLQWFGEGVTRVKGVVDSSWLAEEIDGEDSAMATFAFGNGARGLFYASNCHTANSPLQLEIDGEKGTLLLEGSELWLLHDGARRRLASDAAPDGSGKSYWGVGHREAIRLFYDAVRHPAAGKVCDIHEAAKSLQIVDAIYRSSQLRQWIHMEE